MASGEAKSRALRRAGVFVLLAAASIAYLSYAGVFLAQNPPPKATSIEARQATAADRVEQVAPVQESRVGATSAMRDPAPVAVSAAQPVLSLQAHLEERLRRMPWGDGDDLKRVTSAVFDARKVVHSKVYNPGGKQLTPDQFARLDEIVRSQRDALAPFLVEEGRRRKEAMLRAAGAGNIVSAATGQGPSFPEPAAMEAHSRHQQEVVKNLVDQLRTRLGLPAEDWLHSIMNSREPDGVARQNVVYFTRRDEPGYFVAKDQLRKFKDTRDQLLRDFFTKL